MKSCFFFHNPKAGGTSLRNALAAHFSPDAVCPTADLTPDVYRAQARPVEPGYQLCVGHYGYDICRQVAGEHALITNFRHPAKRIVSLYKYFRYAVPNTPSVQSDPIYFAVRQAKSADFESFVLSTDPRITTYTHNHHFRQLANSGWSLNHSRTLDDVIDLIDQMTWFYMCEFPDLSVRWARKALDASDFKLPRDNVSSTSAAPSADVLQLSEAAYTRLLDMNQVDLAIYAHALERFFFETRNASPPLRATSVEAARRTPCSSALELALAS